MKTPLRNLRYFPARHSSIIHPAQNRRGGALDLPTYIDALRKHNGIDIAQTFMLDNHVTAAGYRIVSEAMELGPLKALMGFNIYYAQDTSAFLVPTVDQEITFKLLNGAKYSGKVKIQQDVHHHESIDNGVYIPINNTEENGLKVGNIDKIGSNNLRGNIRMLLMLEVERFKLEVSPNLNIFAFSSEHQALYLSKDRLDLQPEEYHQHGMFNALLKISIRDWNSWYYQEIKILESHGRYLGKLLTWWYQKHRKTSPLSISISISTLLLNSDLVKYNLSDIYNTSRGGIYMLENILDDEPGILAQYVFSKARFYQMDLYIECSFILLTISLISHPIVSNKAKPHISLTFLRKDNFEYEQPFNNSTKRI